MGIKTVPHPPYSPELASCDFWLFPKLRGCHYETIKEMKEAVTKVIDTLTQEDLHGVFQKLLKRYKCKGRRLLRRGLEFHVCTLNKSAHTKKIWKLIVCTSYIYIYIYILSISSINLGLEELVALVGVCVVWNLETPCQRRSVSP